MQIAQQHLYSTTNIYGVLDFSRAIIQALADATDPDQPALPASGFSREQLLILAKQASSPDESTRPEKSVTIYAAKTQKFLERFAALVEQALRQSDADSLIEAEPVIEPDMPVFEFLDQLELSTRLRNSLFDELRNWEKPVSKVKIKTHKDFLNLSREELLDWPNLGRKTLDELEEKLKESGLHLRNES